jgi:hypothetical protein
MVPKKDIFDQWSEEKEKEFWIVRKLKFISSWWNHEGKYYFKMFRTSIKKHIFLKSYYIYKIHHS